MEIKRNIDGSTLSFPQDERINFEEIKHVYTIDGVEEFTSVSQVIGKFFEPFDAEKWSLRKTFGDEEKARQLRDEWNARGERASQAGTHLHKQIEAYLNNRQEPTLVTQVNYDGEFIHLHETVNIEREWSFFKDFERNVEFCPFRTEWAVFDEKAKIAGTIDLICSCPDGSFEIYDWKRSNRIKPDEQNRWASGKNGLEHLCDTAYIHYCLQQNLYCYILEQNYGLHINQMNLVVLHPDFDDYQIVPIPRMDNEVATIIRNHPYIGISTDM